MTDPVLTDIVNRALRMDTRQGLSDYQVYPPERTALILVDTQVGPLTGREDLVGPLAALVDFARERGFLVVHASFDGAAQHPHATVAHQRMSAMTEGEAAALHPRLQPKGDDLVSAHNRLSVFHGTSLKETLKERGIQHLIIAGPEPTTTLDSTLRAASQFDFHTTIVVDCVATETDPTAVHDTLALTFPRYAHSLLTLEDLKEAAA